MDDAGLISRSLEDGRWFEVLFDRHYAAIHRYLSARAGLAAAEDLASETFTVAFRRRGSYDLSRPDAAPWLYGIALNLLYRHRRTEGTRHRAYALVGAGGDEPTARAGEMFDTNGPVSLALRALSVRDRDLIVLFAWAELTYEQLGVACGLPVGTVRSRLSRIRAQLRDELSASEPNGIDQRTSP